MANPRIGPESRVQPTGGVPHAAQLLAQHRADRRAPPACSGRHWLVGPLGQPHLSGGFTAPPAIQCSFSLSCGPRESARSPQQPLPSMAGAQVPRGVVRGRIPPHLASIRAVTNLRQLLFHLRVHQRAIIPCVRRSREESVKGGCHW